MKKVIVLIVFTVFLFGSPPAFAENLKTGENLVIGSIEFATYKQILRKDGGVIDVDVASPIVIDSCSLDVSKSFQKSITEAFIERGIKIDPSSPIKAKVSMAYNVALASTIVARVSLFSPEGKFLEISGWEGRPLGPGVWLFGKCGTLSMMKINMVSVASRSVANAVIIELRKNGPIVYPSTLASNQALIDKK